LLSYLPLALCRRFVIAVIVLAAGVSSRMGKPKQTLPISGKPMLERVINVYRRPGVSPIVVVLGAHAARVRRSVILYGVSVVYNRRYLDGMSGSLRLGLKAAEKAEAVIVALADQPFLSPDTVNAMIETYKRTGGPVVIPSYRGKRGNPVLFDRSLFPEIRRIRGDRGAKSVVNRHRDILQEVAVDDRGILVDIDTPSDYQEAGLRRKW